MDNFDDVREALAKMTPGEWAIEQNVMRPEDGSGDLDYIAGWNVRAGARDVIGIDGILAGGEADAAGIVTLRNRMADVLAERDKLAAEVKRLRAGLQGMLEIQDVLDEHGSCENEFIVPRVSVARAALKETEHDA